MNRVLKTGLIVLALIAPLVAIVPAATARPQPPVYGVPYFLNHPVFDDAAKVADQAEPDWYLNSIPFVDLPADAGTIEQIYYYRWMVTKEQLTYNGPHDGWQDDVFLGYHNAWMGPNAMRDLRWLRYNGIVENDVATHQITEHLRYTDPTADNVYQYALATGNTKLLAQALPDLIEQYKFHDDYFDPNVGLYWHQPVWDATEHTIAAKKTNYKVPYDVNFPHPEDFLQPLDQFFGGWGYSTPLNDAQAADAAVIAKVAAATGQRSIAKEYKQKAASLNQRMIDYLWDDNRDFFYHVMKDNSAQGYKDANGNVYPQGTKLSGREIWGYYPWQFETVPDSSRFAGAWTALNDPQGFNSAAGPSTSEVRDPSTDLSGAYSPDKDNGNCCRWSGANWPYSDARTLVAMANALDDYKNLTPDGASAPSLTQSDYVSWFKRYADLQHKDGKPYVAEAADAATGKWIYDKTDRSLDYNSYPYDDLVINGLLGVRPSADDTLTLKPLTGASWPYFAAQHVPYHGHDLTIVYDQDGSKYHVGRGLSVWSDGRLIGHRNDFGSLSANVGRTGQLPATSTGTRYDGSRANWAANTSRSYPQTTASYAGNETTVKDNVGRSEGINNVVDGQTIYNPTLRYARWTTVGSPNATDWIATDFGTARPVNEVRLAWWGSAATTAASAVRIQRWDARRADWVDISGVRASAPAQSDTATSYRFGQVSTSKIRVVLTPGAKPIGLTEFEAWGPTAAPAGATSSPVVNCPTAGKLHYEAEDAITNLGGKSPAAPACGWGAVGGLNTQVNYFVDDWSKVKPGDLSATHTGPMWQGFTDTSFVEFHVTVPRAKTWTVTVRYANGIANTPAQALLSTDDRSIGTLALPPTGGWSAAPGGIKTATFTVPLTRGNHTLRLTKGDGYAEYDSIDLS